MPTKPRQFRLPDETMTQIDHLASVWGGSKTPMPRAAVIRETVAAAYQQQTRKPKTRRQETDR
jgi:predicted transcriptional regulator